ncbi:hypothetical protein ACF1CG_16075 [Streptomyces sp. NPDC014773]|uniref:hypothetical protein n=1 Tax=Streptomyces sp. NPDC014773 TaxID=3364908 RepID=UPI0036F55F7E
MVSRKDFYIFPCGGTRNGGAYQRGGPDHGGTGPPRFFPSRRRACGSHGDLRDPPSVTRTALVGRAGGARGPRTARQGRAVSGTARTPGAVGPPPRGPDAPYASGGTDHDRVRRPLSRTTGAAGNVRPGRAVRPARGHLLDAVVRHPVTVI